MLAPSPVVKVTAKDALRKNFLISVAVSCVLIFAFFIAVFISSIVSIFAGDIGYIISLALLLLFVISPLALGVLYYFRRLLWNQDDSALIIFKYFANTAEYKHALQFSFLIGIRLALSAAILYLPCIIVWLLSNEQIYSLLGVSLPIWTSNLWALNSFLAFVASLALVFVMLKFYLAPFIFVSNDSLDPAEAVNMSTIISKRTGADFFGLVLSFAGWILLSLFVAPLIFTLPYFIASYGVHCRFAITAYNRDVDRFNASVTPSFSTDEI